MVAREDQGFFGDAVAFSVFLHTLLQVQEAAQHLEPGIRLEQALPQVAGGVLAVIRRRRVAGAAVEAAQVERQEEGFLAGQFGSHRHFILAHGKVHQRAALEGQQRLGFAR
ncbi:hypothetical protein D9M70_613610 [compost metagenome]